MSVLLIFGTGAVVGVLTISGYKQWVKPTRIDGSSSHLAVENLSQKPTATNGTAKTAAKAATPKPKRKATKSGKKSDKLENLQGIGRVYAKRLSEAGIQTCADLAATPAERIQDIVSPSPNARRPDVTPWIEQAAKFAAAA